MRVGEITVDGFSVGVIEMTLSDEVEETYNVGDGGRGLGLIIGDHGEGGGHGGGGHGERRHHPGHQHHPAPHKNQHHQPSHRPAAPAHDTPHDSHFDSDVPKSKNTGIDSTGPVDRSSFDPALEDPAFVKRMASMGKGEVGLESNLKTQRAIAEQALNRWYVRKQQHGHDLYHGSGGYYARNTFQPVSEGEVERYKRDVLEPVIKGGTNEARGTTGNASNDPGNEVAKHQFERGTPGHWMHLKSGEKVDLPNSYQGGKAEALFHEGPFKRPLKMKEATPPVAEKAEKKVEMPTSTIAPLYDASLLKAKAKAPVPLPEPSPLRVPGADHYKDLHRSDNIEDRRGEVDPDLTLDSVKNQNTPGYISGQEAMEQAATKAESRRPSKLAKDLGYRDIPKAIPEEEFMKDHGDDY